MTPGSLRSGRLPCLLGVIAWLFVLTVCLPARQVPITLLHTSDLQGQLFARAAAPDEPAVGGLLFAARYIDEVRESQRNVLLFDCGDSLGGYPESDGEEDLMIRAMNHLHYDALVVGDRDLGRYTERFDRLEAPLLAANVDLFVGLTDLLGLVPYRILNIDGVRIIVLGLTHPKFHQHFLEGNLEVVSAVQALDALMADIKQLEPDVICLLAHLGAGGGPDGELKAIMRRYPEIDVVLGGHTGQSVPETFFGETLFTQAGAGGLRVGRVDLVWDTVQRKLIKRTARLWKIGNRYLASPVLSKALEPECSAMRARLDEPFAEITGRFARRQGKGLSGADRLVGRALAEVGKAEIVCWTGRLVDLSPGPVTANRLAAAVPEDHRLVSARLTVAELRELLGEINQVEVPRVWGVQWSEASDGALRIQQLDGGSLHARKRFAVLLPEYLAASDGGRFPLVRKVVHQPVARLTRCDHSLRSALRAFLEKHTPIDVTDE